MGQPTRKTYTFAFLLGVVLLLLLAGSMALLAVVSSHFTRRSVEDLSNRVVQQTLARVELRTRALLAQAMNQNAQFLRLLVGGDFDPHDFKQLGGYLSHSLEVLDELTYLGFGREDNGDYIFAERLSNGTVRVREYVADEALHRVIRDWSWQGGDRQLIRTAPWDGYDPRQRPFYRLAREARTNVWTDTYQFWQGNERGAVPGVTCATPLYDGNGALVGVLNSDFDLAALCQFLAHLKNEIPGYAFVVERRADDSRRLIAHPDSSVLPQSDGRVEDLAQMRDRVAAALVQAVLAGQPEQRLLEGAILTFRADGQTFFGGGRRLGHAGEPRWAIGLIVPAEEVMAGVRRNERFAVWAGLACLALAAVVAIRLARHIAGPLQALSREARAIGQMEWNTSSDTISRVEEVAHLANSFAEMRTNLRSFQKFVPADVVKELVSSATEAKLGGQRATLTLFFADVADFTTIAETMAPEALVAHVGEYLGAMSDVILAGRGTLDKFIGDGVMAFWGAPRANARHAVDACRAALDCQRALVTLRERWSRAGRPLFHLRIGLHTGEVIVGNIGSERRLNYTAVGDSVNLTSRLEGLNKFYGTQILLSAATVEAAGSEILVRPVDQVSVKGRAEALTVYELLGLPGDPPPGAAEMIELTREAFAKYLAADFGSARKVYLQLLKASPQDVVSAVMEKRCQEFLASPRPTEWDTTFRMREK